MSGGGRGAGEVGNWFAVAAFFALLTFLWCGPILTDPAHTAADVGDPLHMAWAMAWVGHQLPRAPLALFQSNNFFPYRNSLAFGDHLLPEAVLGLPINLLTGNAVLALNLVTAFGLFSSALAAYFLVSSLFENRSAGLIAGTTLAFNGFMQGELLRVNVLQLQGWCLALWLLWRFIETPTWRHSIGFSLALALQGLTGTYYAVYSAILLPGFFAAAYAARRRLPNSTEVWRLAVPAFVTGVAGFLFLSPYRAITRQSLAQKPIADGADLASFVLPGKDFWLWSGLLPAAPRGESNHFLGYVPLALAGLAVWSLLAERSLTTPVRRFIAFVSVAMLSVGALISLGAYPRLMGAPLGASPFLLIVQTIPILRGMATVERASVLVHFGVALLAAMGAERMFRTTRGIAPAVALAALCAAEQWSRPGPGFQVPAGSEVPDVYHFLAGAQGPVVDLPVFPDRLLRFRALYPYLSTYNWRPVPIGRASFYPPAHDYLATLLQGFPDALSIAALRTTGIRDLVVHPLMWETRRGLRLRSLEGPDFQLLRAFPGEVSAAAKNLGMGDERVYRLAPEAAPAQVCVPTGEIDLKGASLGSSADEGLEKIRDGDLSSFWSTVRPQKEGDFLELGWSDIHMISALELALGHRVSDFPTALRIETAQTPGEWRESPLLRPVESATETLRQLLANDPAARITIRIPAVQARFVRIRVGRDENRPGWNPWSVAEIRVFSECFDNQKP